MLNIFSCACWPSVCFLWRNEYLVSCPFFDWFVCLQLSYMNSSFILEIKLSSVALFANIFSNFIGCVFTLLMISFAVQKVISFIRFHLSIFVFISFALVEWPKKILLWFMSFAYVLSRMCMLSYIIFKSSSHFEFIFEYCVRECSNFTDLPVAVQLFQHNLLKKVSFHLKSCLLYQTLTSVWSLLK